MADSDSSSEDELFRKEKTAEKAPLRPKVWGTPPLAWSEVVVDSHTEKSVSTERERW